MIVYGRNPVKETLLSSDKSINKIYISTSAHGDALGVIIKLAKEKGIPVHFVPPEKLDEFSENSQGVAASISEVEYYDIGTLWDLVKNNERPFLVALDSIEDPHNTGAIIRSAVALGADGIILGKWRSGQVTDIVAKTSAGAVMHIPVARVSNLTAALKDLKEKGVWIAGAQAGAKNVEDEKFSFPICLVIGGEDSGLHKPVRDACDYLISINMTQKISSLNASCAASILLHEIFKQKLIKKD